VATEGSSTRLSAQSGEFILEVAVGWEIIGAVSKFSADYHQPTIHIRFQHPLNVHQVKRFPFLFPHSSLDVLDILFVGTGQAVP
jgi:hypothetical protein